MAGLSCVDLAEAELIFALMMHVRTGDSRDVSRGRSKPSPVIALFMLVLLNTLILWPIDVLRAAEPPFDVRRSIDPAQVRSASIHATTTLAPYDDGPGILDDGISYFYVVKDADGQPVSLSAHKNLDLGTIRLGFNDENDLAAAVDPSQSSVRVSHDTLPADGVSMSQATIIPRDADEVPLGSGLDIQLDLEALSPAFPCGPLIDQGDGSYVLYIASANPGTSQVWITVEGIVLYDEPTVTFESTGGATDLRELAKQSLDGISAISGAFEEALTGIDPDDARAEKMYEAWEEAVEGLEILNKDNYDLDNDVVDNYLKAAIGELVAALDDQGDVNPWAILDLIDDLLDIGRSLAQFHYSRALDSCGPCNPDAGGEFCDAEEALVDGDAERTSADPNYEEAANQYGKTVDKAVDAYQDCTG